MLWNLCRGRCPTITSNIRKYKILLICQYFRFPSICWLNTIIFFFLQKYISLQLSDLGNRLNKMYDNGNEKFMSTMTLKTMDVRETGYYGCTGRLMRAHEQTFQINQYVYVYSILFHINSLYQYLFFINKFIRL
jgi:hypothetical protein